MARAAGCAVAAVACALLVGTARAHVSAVCSATTAKRPGTVTFLIASYHDPPAGASVPGVASIKSPQGTTHEFAFNNFCGIAKADAWDLLESVSYYRERLLRACVCSMIFGCGGYNAATGKCTSTTGDCPTVAPKDVQIDCFGQEDGNPSWVGQSWGRIKGDDEEGNCAYGSLTRRINDAARTDSMFARVYVRRGRQARTDGNRQTAACMCEAPHGWLVVCW